MTDVRAGVIDVAMEAYARSMLERKPQLFDYNERVYTVDMVAAVDAVLDYLEAWSETENEVMMPVCELIGTLRSGADYD